MAITNLPLVLEVAIDIVGRWLVKSILTWSRIVLESGSCRIFGTAGVVEHVLLLLLLLLLLLALVAIA